MSGLKDNGHEILAASYTGWEMGKKGVGQTLAFSLHGNRKR
jgi:hypothetical protein